MTPKEKAEELCYLYQGDFVKGTLNMSWTMAKKCALITIDKILFEHHHYGKIGSCERFMYWNEIKEEINKL